MSYLRSRRVNQVLQVESLFGCKNILSGAQYIIILENGKRMTDLNK